MTVQRPEIDAGTRSRLSAVLRDIRPSSGSDPATWAYSGRSAIPWSDIPVPRIVQWLLHEFLELEDNGRRFDKTAWRFWFTFDGRPFSLAFEKFGVRLYGSAESEADFTAAGNALITVLQKAVAISERGIFQRFANEQISEGRITVFNQHHRLRNMYEYFRSEGEGGLRPERRTTRQPGEPFKMFADDEHRFHYTVATTMAYFGWLEHILVLCWPFCGFVPGSDNVEEFIGDRWGRKFARIFDLANDREAKKHYDSLRGIAETFRNTYSHGGFDKERSALLVHVPGGAPIAAGLSAIRDRPHVEFYPVLPATFAEMLQALDELDAWLKSGPTSFGMAWAEAGLDVPLDPESVRGYREAMEGEDGAFDELIERTSYFSDQASNMDW